MTVIVHATYGLTELLVLSLREAGLCVEELLVVSTQPAETRNALKLLPTPRVITLGRRPRGGFTYWDGMGPSRQLLGLTSSQHLRVDDLIFSDRHLRRFPADVGLAWLNATADFYRKLIDTLRPKFLVGEVANASEVLLAATASQAGIPYVTPTTLRLPSDRFGLFTGPGATTMIPRTASAGATVASPRSESSRPFYFAPNNAAPKMFSRESAVVASAKLRDALVLPEHAMQQPKPADYLSVPWLNRARKVRYGRALARRRWAEVPSQSYAFFPLHVQPEASIDWFGPHWRNQLDVVEHLAQMLSAVGLQLVVKDHPNFLWTRGADFHDRLAAIPNAEIIDPGRDSRIVARGASFTFTVSGTIGLECGLEGLPVVTVADLPWSALPTVEHIPTRQGLEAWISQRQWQRLGPNADRVDQWAAAYSSAGWPGVVADRYGFPDVLSSDNIAAVGEAMAWLLSTSHAA